MKTLITRHDEPSFGVPAGAAEDADLSKSGRTSIDAYAHPDLGRSVLSLVTSVVPFVALWVLMYFSLQVSYLLVLALAIPASGFLLRTYILFHDCAHGSLFAGRRANAWFGTVLGLMVFTPFARWRYEHVVHHATAGNLDRRFVGDVPTYTLAEYEAWRRPTRLAYRLFRNPLIMFGLGPIYAMLLEPRWAVPAGAPRLRRSVWATNLALVMIVGGLCWLLGWREFLLVETPFVFLAGGAGIWLFYVQHQFDHTYWARSPEWKFAAAGLQGSSYLKLPKILQFFTGNIGLHHVHHLGAKVPNYNLQRAHDREPIFQSVPALSFADGLRATRLKVWDESAGRLLTWREVRRARTRAATAAC